MMSEAVKLALIASMPPTLASVVAVVLAFINRGTIKEVKSTGEHTNRLVNGANLVQLKVASTSARELANVTREPEHERMAVAAEQAFDWALSAANAAKGK